MMTMIDSRTQPARVRRRTRDGGTGTWSRIDGCGATKIYLRIRPGGTFAADLGSGSPEARFSFRTAVN